MLFPHFSSRVEFSARHGDWRLISSQVQYLWSHPCASGERNVRRLPTDITSSFSLTVLTGQVLGREDTWVSSDSNTGKKMAVPAITVGLPPEGPP